MSRGSYKVADIVMELARGDATPLRAIGAKAFEDFFYGHVGDNGLPDHVAAIRQPYRPANTTDQLMFIVKPKIIP